MIRICVESVTSLLQFEEKKTEQILYFSHINMGKMHSNGCYIIAADTHPQFCHWQFSSFYGLPENAVGKITTHTIIRILFMVASLTFNHVRNTCVLLSDDDSTTAIDDNIYE